MSQCHKDNSNPVLSIIIPVYNLSDYIANCLNSIYKQKVDESEFEIIIVDDGSTDDSVKKITPYLNIHNNMRLIVQENAGVSAARNKGLKSCNTEFCTFVDGDDELAVDSLGDVINEIKKASNEFDVIYFKSQFKKISHELKSINDWSVLFNSEVYYTGEDLIYKGFFNGGCVWGCIYRLAFLLRNELDFGERIANNEDSIFTFRLLSKVPVILFCDINYYIVNQRYGSASRSTSLERVKCFQNNINSLKAIRAKTDLTILEYQAIDAALYSSISAAVYMYIWAGGCSLKYIKQLLMINQLWKMKAPWLGKNQVIKMWLVNHNFGLYFYLIYLKNKTISASSPHEPWI